MHDSAEKALLKGELSPILATNSGSIDSTSRILRRLNPAARLPGTIQKAALHARCMEGGSLFREGGAIHVVLLGQVGDIADGQAAFRRPDDFARARLAERAAKLNTVHALRLRFH